MLIQCTRVHRGKAQPTILDQSSRRFKGVHHSTGNAAFQMPDLDLRFVRLPIRESVVVLQFISSLMDGGQNGN